MSFKIDSKSKKFQGFNRHVFYIHIYSYMNLALDN